MVHGHPSRSPDELRVYQRGKQLVPWIADPLTHFFHHLHEEAQAQYIPAQPGEFSASYDGMADNEKKVEEEIETEEAEPLELFYDLFFVANLTTITSVHAIVDYKSVVSYILFFIILWFTWLQTTLYDIRFSIDSVYERVVKAIHFAVMISLASVSLSWNPLDPKSESSSTNLRWMALTLMASRFALAIQYCIVFIYARKHRNALLPLAIHFCSMLVAAGVYFGLFWNFHHQTRGYYTMYIVIFVEVFCVMGSSSIWRILSFKRTHLAERMGLLTLIITGEGIIVMMKAVNAVEKGKSLGGGWNAPMFTIVSAAVMIIYFIFMFYFDYTPRGIHFGSIRQQIWAVLHFPFHLAIVLSVEGLRQFSTLYSFIQANAVITRRWESAVISSGDNAEVRKNTLISEIGKFIYALYKEGSAKTVVKNYVYLQSELANLTATPVDSWTNDTQATFAQVILDMSQGYAEFYGIKVPKQKEGAQTTMTMDNSSFSTDESVLKVYILVFQYFFLSIGVVFCMYGILALFVRRRKDIWDYLSVALRFSLGISFICMERIQSNRVRFINFIGSPWPIPTVFLAIFVTLCIDKLIGLVAYRRAKSKLESRVARV